MRRVITMAFVCAALIVTAPAGVDGLINGPNLVGNSGFESALAAAPACATPAITGNWRAVSCAATQVAERVSAPVQAGGFSGHVRTQARNGGQAYFYQDLPGFGSNDSFELSAWVMPVDGPQQIALLFGWDRSTGATVGTAAIVVRENGIDYAAWGVVHSAPALSYDQWHHVKLVGDVTRGKQELFIDGVGQGAVAMGASKIALSVTMLVGQGTGVNTPASEFYFDNISLARLTAPPPDVDQCFADLAACEASAADLASRLATAEERISDLEARLAGAVDEAAIRALVAALTANLRAEFRNPAFVIPGDTPLAQLQNVVGVVMTLNHGRKQGIYTGLH